jgi:predicted dinucleotide-binding enzyme
MSHAIIGFGAVGQALARMFARRNIEVAVASRRSPEALAPQATAIGPTIHPKSLSEALEADIVMLAVPFWQHREVAGARASWQGKIVIDVTNALGVPVADLGGLPSSTVISRALPGARLVKAFNHLPAGVLAQDPEIKGRRRVAFLSGDDESATATVAALVERLGYAPVSLGRIAEGGLLVQARDKTWAPLIFQDLFK